MSITDIGWGTSALPSRGQKSEENNPSIKVQAGVISAANLTPVAATKIPPNVTQARIWLDKLEKLVDEKGFPVRETPSNSTGTARVFAALDASLRLLRKNPAERANVEALVHRVIKAAELAGWISEPRFTWASFVQSNNSQT
ncbi:hypothetical protein [Noviherbaspirillum humi]|uniref:hypothetical protein n=1 Tax=Noviherbaspirillum humi TaxID=1688639 RepID=UPI00116069A5|nr:hypothetical protein [Noviherbaspirillum humi]